jgi:pimeloyl-ACP methyl ester carboxylesterase
LTVDHAPRRGYADSSFGQLHYVEQGTGEPILLLHQTPRSADEFREVLPRLAGSSRAIAMDMLGFGLSATVPAPQSIEQMAAGALALLDALGVDTVAVMGHHTGGAVAVELAASAPERVRAVVLSSAPWTDAAFRTAHAAGPGVDEAVASEDGSHLTQLWKLRQPYYPPGRPDLLDRFIRDALAPGVDPAEGHLACARYRMEDRIGLVRAPVLLLGASADPFALPDLQPLHHHLTAAADVRTVVLDGGTIPLMEQLPDEVAAAVLEFLAHVAS